MSYKTLKIEEFCETGSGGTPSRNKRERYYGGHIPWIKSGELKDDLITRSEEKVTDDAISESSAKIVNAGAVLVAMYGATVGRTAFLGIEAATNQAVCHIEPNPEIAEPKYVWYALRTKLPDLLRQRVGGAQPNISQKIIRNTSINVPPLSEQRRIVEILDQADALRKKRAEANAKAERLLPALFYKMFGDPIELERSNRSLPLKAFSVELQNGFACGQKDISDGTPHLRMNNIDDRGILNTELMRKVPQKMNYEKYRLCDDDILFMSTNSEDKIGKTCVFRKPFEGDFLYSNHLTRIRINDERISPEYLATYLHLLWKKDFYPSRAKRWVNQASLSQEELRRIRVFPTQPRQQRLFKENHDNLMSFREKSVLAAKELDSIFSVLMYRAFSGDLTGKYNVAPRTQPTTLS